MTTRAKKRTSTEDHKRGDDALALSKVMPHHRAAWRVERIGWAAIAVLLIATLLGAFGGGPISHVRAGSGGLVAEYYSLQRASADTEYRFEIDTTLVRDGRFRMRFDQDLLDDIQIESITPEPQSAIAGDGHTDFVFDATPGEGPAHVVFRFQPATFGRRAGRVEVPGAPPLELDQFAFP